MLLLKKLCRINASANRNDRPHASVAENRQPPGGDASGRPAARTSATAACTAPGTARLAAAGVEDDEDDHDHDHEHAARQPRPVGRLCRTPPPLYNCLPATPPPSYTASSRPLYAPAATRPAAEQPQPQSQPQSQHALSAPAGVRGVADPVRPPQRRAVAPRVENARQAQQQQQQQLRRRQRLLSLQQRFIVNIARTNNSSSSSSNSSSSSSSSSGSGSGSDTSSGNSSDLEAQRARRRRHRRRRRRRPTGGIRDVYCPDILNACSLILHPQQQQQQRQQQSHLTSDSSVGSFTESPSDDYAQINATARPAHAPQRDLVRERAPSPAAAAAPTPAAAPERTQSNHTADVNQNVVPWRLGLSGGNCESSVGASDRDDALQDQRPREDAPSSAMGQNLSLRRPRISLTWVLREQQQPSQPQSDAQKDECSGSEAKPASPNNNNATAHGHGNCKDTQIVPTQLDTNGTGAATTTTTTTKKRYRVKQLPGGSDPLNGYATTPTAHAPPNGGMPMSQKFFSNQNLLDYKDKSRAPTKELLFVCTPQRLPKSYDTNEALALAKKRNEIRKRLAAKMAALQASNERAGDGAEIPPPETSVAEAGTNAPQQPRSNCGALPKEEFKALKGTYSEPSLMTASEGTQHRRHRHRKRRERNRPPKFGYEIGNVEEFLAKCSLAAPANIPVVLGAASTLYQTRPGGYQAEVPLPLGMVVNAVFKNQNWLYVQTPHAEEGYVGYKCCLPLGILPPAARNGGTPSGKPTPCWESNGDIFPRPCGNMTDSEKEIRLRGGTRSDGARTPRAKCAGGSNNDGAVNALNGNASHHYSEHHVDKLYLRAASQPKLVEKAYAQLRTTKNATLLLREDAAHDEYVTLHQHQHQHQHQQKSKLHMQQHMQLQQQQLHQKQKQQIANGPFLTNGQNGQHLHPKSLTPAAHVQARPPLGATKSASSANVHLSGGRKVQHGLRQTLVAINADYSTESISLQKGEIVTLCECRESKDRRQWFYVKTRDGREGYIPAEVAGHGYL